VDSPTYITITTASSISGVPELTLRRWIATGALQARTGDEEQLVRLDDVRVAQERADHLSGERARPLEGTVVTPGDLTAPERPLTPPRHDGIALVGALVGAMIGKLDALYSEALTAKDHELAAKDELIVELRRQVRQAERDVAAPGGAALTPHPMANWPPDPYPRDRRSSAPLPDAREGETPFNALETHSNHAQVLRRRQRLLAVGLIFCGIVALNVALTRVSGSPAAARPRVTPPTRLVGAADQVPVTGVPLVARRALGGVIGLNAPHAAVMLPDGDIAVADTGNRRLALLDDAGRLLRGEQDGRLREPVALVVAASKTLYVLDAERGAIERYDVAGRFVRDIARNADLRGASSMALGRHGLLYIANPRLHAIVVMLSVTGKIERLIGGPLGASSHFVSPVDVGIGAGDKIYVLDSGGARIVAVTSDGRLVARWPIVPGAAGASGHLLPLPDGRVLLSNASGAIVVYDEDSALPPFKRALTLAGGQGRAYGPLGLSRTSHGAILVTDTVGGRLLLVPVTQGS